MSKPGKVLKALCKKLGVRLTVKRGKKRVYKSIKVLKRQCANKKKRKVKRRRKFGTSLVPGIDKNRIFYIIVGKRKPEEGAMSMFDDDDDDDETVYGYGQFIKYPNKKAVLDTMLGSFNNITKTMPREILLPIDDTPFFPTHSVYDTGQEKFRNFNEGEKKYFKWFVFNPFHIKALEKQQKIINLDNGNRTHIKRMRTNNIINIPRPQKKIKIIPEKKYAPLPKMTVYDSDDSDSEYDDIEFGKRRRKRKLKRKKVKKKRKKTAKYRRRKRVKRKK